MNNGGGGDVPPPQQQSSNGGEFLLSLLQRPPLHHPTPPQSQFSLQPPPHQQQQQQQPSLTLDPAVAAVGPSISLTQPPFWPPYGGANDLVSQPPWTQKLPASQIPPGFLGLPQNPWASSLQQQFQGNQQQQPQQLGLGFSNVVARDNSEVIHNLFQVKRPQVVENKVQFGSFMSESVIHEGNVNSNSNSVKDRENIQFGNIYANGLDRNRHLFDSQPNANSKSFDLREQDRRGGHRVGDGGRGGWRKNHHDPPPHHHHHSGGNHRPESQMPHSQLLNKPRGGRGGGGGDSGAGREAVGNGPYGSWRRESGHIVNKNWRNHNELSNRNVISSGGDEILRSLSRPLELGLTGQLDRPGPPVGSNLNSVSKLEFEESLLTLDSQIGEDNKGDDGRELDDQLDDLGEELVGSLLHESESEGNKDTKLNRKKETRLDGRRQRILGQRMRMLKWNLECRGDVHRMNAPFLAIFESLMPLEEERAKQKQLLSSLEKIVNKEWPEARLYLYGSCANSFGVLKSDIDVCLAIEDENIDKLEILLRLAEILESDNLQNVQALTRARVPIVKLMDPATGISCDICINNVLAVVNTKLLRDYAEIDVRLRQLAFIVKHWAKSRGVNETYQGTLSSYAYVLMCIHFLQLRRPAILPCLQEMEPTYSVTIDDVKCFFYDKVENLQNFGSRNKETIAQLVWAFFNYWAYRHDYTHDVISVRTGSIISKHEKDWTRRIGNDRHLICIEDPFEISHDLGRVVDKHTIKVLRHEFERAAEIMQYDPNPCVTLFEPYTSS